jgi:hypothetical protein
MKTWQRQGLAVCLALAMTSAGMASIVTGAIGSSSKRAAKSLERALDKRNLETLERPRCKSKDDGSRIACTWTAEGHPKGGIPFECDGRARRAVGRKRWTIKGCEERLITLLPTPGAHPLFGYNEAWHVRGGLEHLYDTSANVARQILVWGDIQPIREDYRWFPFDALYIRMLAAGVRPIWVLAHTPCWAQEFDPGRHCYRDPLPPAPDRFDETAEFMALAAQRYPLSAGFEVWNEPNYVPFWQPYPDPEAYGQMTAQIATAIHAVAPDMPVISAGMAPVGNDGEDGIAYDNFLRRAYETGGPQLTDAIGAHPYPLGNFKQDYLGAIRSHLYRYLDVMNDFGEAAKPIWVTETGVSNYEDERGFTEREQAIALVEIYEQFRRIANLPVVVFHRFKDDPHGGGKEPGYGVVDGNNVAKDAYCAIAAAREEPCDGAIRPAP